MKRILFFLTIAIFSAKCCENKPLIRPGQPSDIVQLNALSTKQYQKDFKPLWQEFYACLFRHINVDTFVDDITQRNNNRNESIINKTNSSDRTQLLVAEIKNQKGNPTIAGFCRFELQDEKNMYLHFIVVDEDLRKQGIAKALALAAIKTFPNTQQCHFRAHVGNKKINEIYLAHGCEQVGEVSIDLESGQLCNNPDAPMTHYQYVYNIIR